MVSKSLRSRASNEKHSRGGRAQEACDGNVDTCVILEERYLGAKE